MHLEVISPDKKVFDAQVTKVTFPGEDGLFQVLENHAPMIASLKQGNLDIKGEKNDATTFKISSGVVEIKNNTVIVLVESIME